MTLRYSTGARQFMASIGSYKDAFQNGRIELYTGAQPASADAAVTGTLICTVTDTSLGRTAEVLSSGTLTLSTGASGSVDTLTVNGVDVVGSSTPFNASLTQTAADIATKINAFKGAVRYRATSAGAVVTIKALPGTGATPNTFVVAATYTTITGSVAAFASGVTAANGLRWDDAVGGVMSKAAAQVWSGVNGNSNSAGWYRQYGSVADTGALDSTGTYVREDGAVGVSAAELLMPTVALANGATTVLNTWQRTITTL